MSLPLNSTLRIDSRNKYLFEHGFNRCQQTLRDSKAPNAVVQKRNSIASCKAGVMLALAMYS